jgi:hypothetical protein
MSRQIKAKDIDLKIISKIFEFLAEGHESERSRTFLEIKDANGRAFRYASVKDWTDESKNCMNGKVEVRNIDEAFGNMVERISDKGTPRSNLHAILEDDEDGQEKEKEEEEEEGSNQGDQACPLARDQGPARR